MRGFVYSFALGAALFVAMKHPPIQNLVGFFGAVPLAFLDLPFRHLRPQTGSEILVFAPAILALLAHVAFRRGERLLRDSAFTLFVGVWIPYAIGELQLLCEWGHGYAEIAQGACAGIPGAFSSYVGNGSFGLKIEGF